MMGRHPAVPVASDLARTLGWGDAPWETVDIVDTPTALATRMPIADMAVAAQALIGVASAELHHLRGGPGQRVTVDRREASLSMTPAAYLRVDGETIVEWDPLTGYFRAADGWVYLHTAFHHLRDRLLAALDLPVDRDAVAAGLARMPAQVIEDRAAAAGACAIRHRERAEWEAHPQARVLAERPVIGLERIDGGAPPLPAAGAAPLSGVRVLDISRVIAGPTIGRVLAEHGADVLQIAGPQLPSIGALVIDTGHGKRSASCSINFVTSHDGFTMNDLVSYKFKHNEANNEGNRDGDNNNFSDNYGVEGPTKREEVLSMRSRQIRNKLTTLMLSQGVPMMVAGDECRRTQRGNNNAYCQDNELSWFDWSLVDDNQDLLRFVQSLIQFRRQTPTVRRHGYLSGTPITEGGMPDVSWYSSYGTAIDWGHQDGCLTCLLVAPDEVEEDELRKHVLLLVNGTGTDREFVFPAFAKALQWRLYVDTAAEPPADIFPDLDGPAPPRTRRLTIPYRSLRCYVTA